MLKDKSWEFQVVTRHQEGVWNMEEKTKERCVETHGWPTTLHQSRFTKSSESWNIWKKRIPPLPATLTSQYYSLKEIFKLRDIYIGRRPLLLRRENRPWEGEGQEMVIRVLQDAAGKPVARQLYVLTLWRRRFLSAASFSRHEAFAFVPSSWNTFLAFYRETLWS